MSAFRCLLRTVICLPVRLLVHSCMFESSQQTLKIYGQSVDTVRYVSLLMFTVVIKAM